MSKPYRIRLQETVTVADRSTFHIDPVPLSHNKDSRRSCSKRSKNSDGRPIQKDASRSPSTTKKHGPISPTRCKSSLPSKPNTKSTKTSSHGVPDVLEQEAERIDNASANSNNKPPTSSKPAKKNADDNSKPFVAEATGRAIEQAAERLRDMQEINESRGEKGQYTLSITIHERE